MRKVRKEMTQAEKVRNAQILVYTSDSDKVRVLLLAGFAVRHSRELGTPREQPIFRMKETDMDCYPSPAWGYIYVFAAGDLVKIGMSDAGVQARWHSIRCANPLLEPSLYVSRPLGNQARTAERKAHEELAAHHYSGEWFRCSRELAIETVRRICDAAR